MDDKDLLRELRILKKKLERSESDRAELETNKEKDETLLRKVILELKTSQQELNEKSGQLERTLDELNAAQDELIQSAKMAALGELVAGISHEINTPIGVSVTAASHLRVISKEFRQAVEDKQLTLSHANKFAREADESADMILRNLQRAAELVRDFKQVAVDRSFEGPREFNLSEYLNSIMTSISSPIKKRGIRTEINGPEDLNIYSDPGLLSQVITNLVMNSLTHAYEGLDNGLILINFYHSDENFNIDYQDNGCGIEAAHLEKIFDPFFTTRRGRGGSGLGLNIVYNIVVTKLQGSISCESERGVGTCFKLKLPDLPRHSEALELDNEQLSRQQASS